MKIHNFPYWDLFVHLFIHPFNSSFYSSFFWSVLMQRRQSANNNNDNKIPVEVIATSTFWELRCLMMIIELNKRPHIKSYYYDLFKILSWTPISLSQFLFLFRWRNSYDPFLRIVIPSQILNNVKSTMREYISIPNHKCFIWK